MNPKVDAYIGRSQRWPDEISLLRPILLGRGLDEDLKWGKPCYVRNGANIAIVQEMKPFLALMFFKGALLQDTAHVLFDQGPNSRSARRMQFCSTEDVIRLADTNGAYVDEAIEVEAAGLQVGPGPRVPLVEALQVRLDEDPRLREAFRSLTPGRQREYNLHFSAPKRLATQAARVDKHVPRILEGKGLRDR